MVQRHHPVLAAVPDADRAPGLERDAPVPNEGEAVVAPAASALERPGWAVERPYPGRAYVTNRSPRTEAASTSAGSVTAAPGVPWWNTSGVPSGGPATRYSRLRLSGRSTSGIPCSSTVVDGDLDGVQVGTVEVLGELDRVSGRSTLVGGARPAALRSSYRLVSATRRRTCALATRVPTPCLRVSIPFSTRSSSARRMVGREIARDCANSISLGSRSPGSRSPRSTASSRHRLTWKYSGTGLDRSIAMRGRGIGGAPGTDGRTIAEVCHHDWPNVKSNC